MSAGGNLRGRSLTADEVDLDTAKSPEANPRFRAIFTKELSEGVWTLAGGDLRGGSLTADEVDLDTCAGDVDIGRLMGNAVALSTEDSARGASGVGRIRVGAVYTAALRMQSGAAARSIPP